ncbi:MAG: branched-chain amino acid ABC transporter permease [Pseudomonadota bacterium]
MSRNQQSAATAGLWRRAALPLGLLAAAVILPHLFHSRFMLSVLIEMCIAITFALSYNMLLGQCGLLSFGHAVFFGLGGFFTMHALNMVNDGRLPLPLEILPLCGGLGALVAGLLFGYISTRRAGTPFALISLGLGELIAASALMLPSFFGGEEGVSGDRMARITLTPFGFGQQIEVYYLVVFWMLVSIVLMKLQTQTPLGRMAGAVRDNPERTAFVGYDTHGVRTLQFAQAAFFAGIAGGMFALNYEIVTAEVVGQLTSANVLMMTYIGGVGYFFGPILGAVLITLMELLLSTITHAWVLYYGLMFVALLLWAPGGLAGLIMMHEPLRRGGKLGKLLKSYVIVAGPALVLFTGFMLLIELNYHLSLSIDPEKAMNFVGIEFHAQSTAPWALSLSLIAVGYLLFRPTARMARNAWRQAHRELKETGAMNP